jgi:sugar phosphate isomerase/epimerase
MKRREFIQNTTHSVLALSAGLTDVFAETKLNKKVGIQLFSLPKMLSDDFEKGIKMLAKIGYKEIEMYGPFPFSTDSAKKNWAAVTPNLGFSGSGYFGKKITEIKKIFDDNGLKTPSTHTDLNTLETNMGPLAEAAHILGQKYVTLPAIPDEIRKTLEDYKRIADRFNKIGENAQKLGIKYGYHNHGYGIKPTADGIVPLEIILKNTDPKLVFFEMDLFWTTAGGADPIDYLTRYSDRYKMLHIKDMKAKKEFEGDGGNAAQWIPLFGNMTTAGNGVLDLEGIIKKAHEIGIEHYFVEQDMVADPTVALKKSFDYLKGKV